jgi:hypothetical protein
VIYPLSTVIIRVQCEQFAWQTKKVLLRVMQGIFDFFSLLSHSLFISALKQWLFWSNSRQAQG